MKSEHITFFHDDFIPDKVLFIGDEDDHSVTESIPPDILETRMGIAERITVGHGIHYNVRIHGISSLVCLKTDYITLLTDE